MKWVYNTIIFGITKISTKTLCQIPCEKNTKYKKNDSKCYNIIL